MYIFLYVSHIAKDIDIVFLYTYKKGNVEVLFALFFFAFFFCIRICKSFPFSYIC